MLLRYFTIDEEYWASEYDDDGDLEEEWEAKGRNEGYYDDDDDDDHDEEEDLEEFGFLMIMKISYRFHLKVSGNQGYTGNTSNTNFQ